VPHYDVTPERPAPTVSRSPLLGFGVAVGVAYGFAAEAIDLGPSAASVGFGLLSALVAVRIAVRQLPRWLRARRTTRRDR
jgi:hypothetical protein